MANQNLDKYQILKQIIKDANSIVVFTGAGISVPSNIPDFRSSNGLYNQDSGLNIPPEEIISHHFYLSHPEEFFEFYKTKMCYPHAEPNLAHKYFADLEKQGKNVTVVTQNIDGLHQKAGSKRVYELHGSVLRNYCEDCNKFYTLEEVLNKNGVPHCDKCGGIIKPDVVLYEEGLDSMTIEYALAAIMTCDVMIVIGTSLVVYPAASFVHYFKGKYLILINKQKTAYDDNCDLVFNEDVINVIERIK